MLFVLFSHCVGSPRGSAGDALYDAGFTYHSTDGSRGSTEAAAPQVLANATIRACLPLLCRFPDLRFVILPEPHPAPLALRTRDSGLSSSGSATRRSRQWSTSGTNPVVRALVARFVAFTQEEQTKSGIVPKQAPAMLRPGFRRLLSPMRTQNGKRIPSTP